MITNPGNKGLAGRPGRPPDGWIDHASVAGVEGERTHLNVMMQEPTSMNARPRRMLLLGAILLSLLALTACAGGTANDAGKTQLDAPRFDPQIGGA